MLDCQRHLFDVPDEVCYLNSAYMAPRLKSVSEAGLAAIERGKAPWKIKADDFFSDVEKLRAVFASLIDAQPGQIALIPSVSYGMAIAAANLPVPKDSEIIVLAEQFPSNVYPWQTLAGQNLATVVSVQRPQNGDWTEAVVNAISTRTAVAALPQVHWTDGSAIRLHEIRRRCDETGTALVLDLTQSLGAAPFSVTEVAPDFAVAAAYKWLLGPYSIGFLYAAPHWHQGQPLEQAWGNRRNSEDFAGLVDYQDAYRAGARRFDVGETANFSLLPMAMAALTQIQAWGVTRINEYLATITGRIAERAEALGLALPPVGQRSSHMLGLRFPGPPPDNLTEVFSQQGVHVSLRGRSIRVAPHLHVNDQDLERFFSVLEKHSH